MPIFRKSQPIMNTKPHNFIRVIGISLSTRGVGFALMEGDNDLVDWGLRVVKGDKNARCLSHVGNLITRYEPTVIALEDTLSAGVRRASRVHVLSQEIAQLARSHNIRVKVFTRKHIRSGLLHNPVGTKHAVAEHLGSRFKGELGFRIPKKRRCGMNADSRMDVFDAVALAANYY